MIQFMLNDASLKPLVPPTSNLNPVGASHRDYHTGQTETALVGNRCLGRKLVDHRINEHVAPGCDEHPVF